MPNSTSAAASEFLPATGAATQEIVLLHGWGCDRAIWRPMLAYLRSWANVTLVDIPGCSTALGAPVKKDLFAVLGEVVSHCPPSAIFMGWSLGGQLASEIARAHPSRVNGVVTVCSNPRFVAADDWLGMPAEEFDLFTASAAQNMKMAVRRFDSLQCKGAARPRQLQRQLQSLRAERASSALEIGLGWLGELDLRSELPQLPVPQLHILAEADSLVPSSVCESLQTLLQTSRAYSSVQILRGTSHVAPLEVPGEIAQLVRAFLQSAAPSPSTSTLAIADFEKEDVAASFSRAARSYDAAASLQRDVGTALLARLNAHAPGTSSAVETVVDLGCGTGYFSAALHERYPNAEHIGLDLAPGMVAYARESVPQQQYWAVADAESLPLATDSVDVIFSSLALQWCSRPDLLFAELGRVLRPGGRCVFATLGPETLKELRASWASVDQRQHVNRFLCTQQLTAAASARGRVELSLETQMYVMRYGRVKELLLELKALGAHNVNRNRASGLTGRDALRDMQRAYEEWRCDGLLPATYEVVFGVLEAA